MNEFNAVVGKAYMLDTTIKPGAQDYNCVMHLAEGATSAEAVGKMLFYYLTGATVPLTIQGSATSTTIEPLKQGLSQLKLASSMNGVTDGLIKQIEVFGDLATVAGGVATARVTIYNPLDTVFALKHIKASCTQYLICNMAGSLQHTSIEVGMIDYELPEPLVIGPKGTVQSGDWPVTLNTAQIEGVLSTIFSQVRFYNVTQTASVVVGDAFETTQMYYTQKEVPYVLNIPEINELPSEALQGACDTPGASAMSLALNETTTVNSTSSAAPTSTVLSTTSIPVTSTTIAETTTTEEAQPTTTNEPTTNEPTTTEKATTEAPTTSSTEPAAESTV